MWWESICHVSLGEPSYVPKQPRIGLEAQSERQGLAENFQGLTKKYLYSLLHGGFPCEHVIRQYPFINLQEGIL